MKIHVIGEGEQEFLDALTREPIEFERQQPRLGVVQNSAGETIAFIGKAVPWAAVAAIVCAWIKARASRKIMVQKDGKTYHLEGLGVDEMKEVLEACDGATMLSPKQSPAKSKNPFAP